MPAPPPPLRPVVVEGHSGGYCGPQSQERGASKPHTRNIGQPSRNGLTARSDEGLGPTRAGQRRRSGVAMLLTATPSPNTHRINNALVFLLPYSKKINYDFPITAKYLQEVTKIIFLKENKNCKICSIPVSLRYMPKNKSTFQFFLKCNFYLRVMGGK